jgi:hypothetical protein
MRKSFLLFRKIGLKHLVLTAGLNLIFISGMYAAAGDNVIKGSSMDTASLWNVTVIGSGATFDSTETVIWNYTTDGPAAGSGGCLYLSDTITGSMTSQYCIWQAVQLEGGHTYLFDAAFKSDTSQQAWSEVYIGTVPPNHGTDVTVALGWTQLQNFNSWAACNVDAGYDGTYDAKGCGNGKFMCTATGTYYFIIKTGNTTWDATVAPFAYMIDNVTLVELPLLIGGNMENASDWKTSFLAGTDTIFTATWNYTADVPAAGAGGCLHVTDTATAEMQFCIYQPVLLAPHSTYQFTGAYKDIAGANQSWNQVYISPKEPKRGVDLVDQTNGVKQLIQFNFWAACKENAGFDGTYQADGCGGNGQFTTDTAGTYYLAIKAGHNLVGGTLDILMDELNLTFVPDTTHPSIALASIPATTVHKKFAVRILFSEPVTGFSASDLTVTNGTLKASDFHQVNSLTYLDSITPVDEGTVTISIEAGKLQDLMVLIIMPLTFFQLNTLKL